MSQDDRRRRRIVVCRERPQHQSAKSAIFDQSVKVRGKPGHAPFDERGERSAAFLGTDVACSSAIRLIPATAFGSSRSSPRRRDASITLEFAPRYQIGEGLRPTLRLSNVLAAP